MVRGGTTGAALWIVLSCLSLARASDGTPNDQALGKAHTVLAGAEERFTPPPAGWFAETQQALQEEADRISHALEKHDPSTAAAWKEHLRWPLLERNLGALQTVNIAELEIVRRWMYSNRLGLESPFFAELRRRMDDYLDAAYTLAHPDLRATFAENVALARQQCEAIAIDPSDANAAALGRTLGWFERTRQLTTEVDQLRALVSRPNAQLVVSGALIRRVIDMQDMAVAETIPVRERVSVPPQSPLQRERTIDVNGQATTRGRVDLELAPNDQEAEFGLRYNGSVQSRCRGVTGPVTLHLVAMGTAEAVKPLYFGVEGLRLGDTTVTPRVTSHVTQVTSPIAVARRIGERRADQPQSRSQMNSQAKQTTVEQLRVRLDDRVEAAIAKLQHEAQSLKSSLGQFSEIAAPLQREGATPYFDGARSTTSVIELNAYARRREQLGAVLPCDVDVPGADIMGRVHISLLNNMAETTTGGKTLSDEFFMRYAKVLHEELPVPLMVHARAPRWSFTMAKFRPIEFANPERDQFIVTVRIDAVAIDGAELAGPSTATIRYRLAANDLGEYELQRQGEVELASALDPQASALVREKVDAFFGPLLNGGGVVVPEGGVLGALRELKSRGVRAEGGWIVVGIEVPPGTLDNLIRIQQAQVAAR